MLKSPNDAKEGAEIVKEIISDCSPRSKRSSHTIVDSLMRYAEFLGYGDVHIKVDQKTGLKAIIAIHNLKRGPAIGGCRFVPYATIDKAMEDALRLGYMMSYKAAINNLPHGGAKAVIIKPKEIKDRVAFFEKYGDFVNELGGRYITAVDSGTSPLEMDIIAKRTKFVTCTSESGAEGDPSPVTALGVRRAIEAAVKFKLKRDSLEGIHVAIQGTGHVGYALAKELHDLGAKLTVSDINLKSIQRCVDEFGASVCAPEEIYHIDADVFSPCALGAVLNLKTIKQLKTPIVAGSANNQLSHSHYGSLLQERGILYAPDFLINAGGLIHVAVLYDHGSIERSLKQINDIYHTVTDIFERSARENISTNKIAERIAKERLG
jgi:leucine dehydrogenase